MTAWARYTGPLARELQLGIWMAYSVRPDMWPPGWGDVRVQDQGWGGGYLAYYALPPATRTKAAEAERLGLGAPGLAESLVLGSSHDLLEIRSDLGGPGEGGTPMVHWVPCEEPT